MRLAHRIEVVPNRQQEELSCTSVGASRLGFTGALGEWKRQYALQRQDKTQRKPNERALRRQFNTIKRQPFAWVMEIPQSIPQPRRGLLEKSHRHSHGQRGNSNCGKSALVLARFYGCIANNRKDRTHELTTHFVREFTVIVIEDVNVQETMRNGHFSRALVGSACGRSGGRWNTTAESTERDSSSPTDGSRCPGCGAFVVR